MSIHVILADHHPVVRAVLSACVEGLAPEVELAGAVADSDQLLRLVRQRPADVYLIDVSLPHSGGLLATEQVLLLQPQAKIIVLSTHSSDVYVCRSLQAGAHGYLMKEYAVEELGEAVRQVAGGRLYVRASPPAAQLVPALA